MFSRAISSPQFTFLVGKNRVPITIHADIVTDLSAPLAAMINNGVMTESTTRIAVLDDVEEWVFRKFCQFSYTGSYSVKLATSPRVTTRPNTSTSNHANLTATTSTPPNNNTEDLHNRHSTTESTLTVSTTHANSKYVL
jgi:hypothetical protein